MAPSKFPHPLLPVLAGCLVTLPVLAPVLAAQGAAVAGAVIHAAFAAVCHQLPERSFVLAGEQVAVCHRCLGLYAGGFLGLVLLPWLPALRHWLLERPRRLAWFTVPLLVDVVLPFDAWWSRSGTGLLAAFPVAAIVWVAWDEIFGRAPASRGEPAAAAPG
jgi:uncharacterized membrane protein